MSPIAKSTTTEYAGAEIESSPLKYHAKELLTHSIESEDFAEFVKKLEGPRDNR